MSQEQRTLAMFPLGTVLFPHAPLSLHVFEPRYRVMMHDVLGTDREFGVVLIERGHEVGGGDVRFAMGTMASVVSATETPDGRWAVVAVGIARIRVDTWLADDPYPRARVTAASDDQIGASGAPGARAARSTTLRLLREYLDLAVELDARLRDVAVELSDDLVVSSFEAAARAPIGALDAQRVLEIDAADERFEAVAGLVGEQLEMLRARLEPPPG